MASLTPEDPNGIVAFDAEIAAELEITLKTEERFKQCAYQHKHVVVDQKARTLTCKHCGFIVDPFEYIERWAVEGERRMTTLKRLDHEIRVRSAENHDLQQQIIRNRGTLRRDGTPQLGVEKDQYRTALWNPGKTFPEVVK